MRRRIVLALFAPVVGVVALSTAAGALPGLSVNRSPVSVNRAADTVDGVVPGGGPTQADRADAQRRRTRQRRAALVAHWQGVAECESGGDWSIDTGNGYYGGLQFSLETWRAYGGRGMPNEQPAWYQSGIAERVRHDTGLGAWPHCGQYYRS